VTRDAISHNFFLESFTNIKGVIFFDYDFNWDRRCRVGGMDISGRVLNEIFISMFLVLILFEILACTLCNYFSALTNNYS
jgi:hypothetical protein